MGWQDAPEVGAADKSPAWMSAPEIEAMPEQKKRGLIAQFGEDTKQTLLGGLRGAAGIGATLLSPGDALVGYKTRREDIESGLNSLGADSENIGYSAGKFVAEIAGTAGAGGALAKGAALMPGVAKYAPNLITSIASSGMTAGSSGAGVRGVARNAMTRAAGGATAGAGAAGLINPDDAATGAFIGGVTPGAVKLAGSAGGKLADAYRYIKRDPNTVIASKMAEAFGMSPAELVKALESRGPGMLPGYMETVPQRLQNPVASQLQRTLKTAGTNALGDAERVQQGAYRNALERVAPIDLTAQDAAQRTGGAIQAYAVPARADAGKSVSQAFDAVDPFNESALYLPIDEMQLQKGKYLGDGTFGTGSKASAAINEAWRVGTEIIPAVEPLSREAKSNSQTLEKAVRAMGGMRGGSGELRDLGIKQSGTTGLVNNKTGQSADLLAEEMYRRGFIPDNDPATLMDALRNGGGRKIFANDQVDSNGLQRMAEAAMGDAPGAETISKAVPFQTVQNLRSSMGEAAESARSKGANKEAAALEKMIGEIDSRVNRAAGGSVAEGEFFPKDMGDQYRAALKAHADKMDKFETGPQIGMFRKGGDGQASLQGAEIPGKFFSGRRSQVEDVKAFKKLIGNREDLAGELKRYAVTEGAGTSNVAGDLTSKYLKWMESRSGASRELFTASELATLKEVGKAVERGIGAENLGRVSGSDTAQKLESLRNLGTLDSKAVNMLATRIPVVGSFTGPMLSSLRETAAQTRNKTMAQLLSNPDELAAALKPGAPKNGKVARLLQTPEGQKTLQMLYRVAPVTSAQ